MNRLRRTAARVLFRTLWLDLAGLALIPLGIYLIWVPGHGYQGGAAVVVAGLALGVARYAIDREIDRERQTQ